MRSEAQIHPDDERLSVAMARACIIATLIILSVAAGYALGSAGPCACGEVGR